MNIISSEIMTIGWEFAAEWVAKPMIGQRPTSKPSIERYRLAMELGQWNLGEGQIVIGVRPSGSYLVAGMHRLSALCELESVTIEARVTYLEFTTDDEMLHFYAEGTNSGRQATLGNALQTLGTGSAIGLHNKEAAQFASGLRLIANGFITSAGSQATGLMKQASLVDTVMREWGPQINAYYHCADGANSKTRSFFVNRAAVIAVGLVTMRYQPEKALDFWTKTANNDGLRVGEPEHTLVNFLSQNTARDGGMQFDYACKVIKCWNSFYYKEPRHNFRGTDWRKETLVIAGTPWSGNRAVDPLVILGIKKEEESKESK